MEGKAKIKVPTEKKISKQLPVFFNPVMESNRTITISILRNIENKKMQFGLPLGGTGVRVVRFLKEVIKGGFNPTTKEDSQAEKLIIEIIKSKFPDHDFLGEELGGQDSNAEYKWIIDPIDGTNNYVAKRDTFTVSIGLEHNEEIILGVVYFPKRNELFIAEKGKGATLNDKPIQIKNEFDLSKAVVTCAIYWDHEEEFEWLQKAIIDEISNSEIFGSKKTNPIFGGGSVAAELCYVACGRIDGLIRLKQKPWDVSAGQLIASEAGADLFNLKGEKTSVYEGDYIAGNPELVKKLLKIIKNAKS